MRGILKLPSTAICKKTIHNPQFITGYKNKRFSFYQASFWTSIMMEYIQANNRKRLGFYGFGDALKDNHP
jgi:hypothetical protein